jgi:hypothetical protein
MAWGLIISVHGQRCFFKVATWRVLVINSYAKFRQLHRGIIYMKFIDYATRFGLLAITGLSVLSPHHLTLADAWTELNTVNSTVCCSCFHETSHM